ncbi:hypothetical protein K438DRAFT_184619 [Mycena galopus ATCC 62051]|nr:hypothetical protein K438DRAFT_184619 [Mycena galopus ATCC 62051]
MTHFAHDRFLNFHGLPCARLSVDQSVYDPVKSGPSILFRAISFILFFSPQTYLRALKKAYTDKTVVAKVWKVFIDKLNREWEEYTRLSTIIMNANVGLLAISSIDALSDNRHSALQILSYLSILCSIGSIVLGLLLVRQNRAQFGAMTYEISASVHRRANKVFGLELLALTFALPSALFMWSMIFFFGAFMVACMRVQDAAVARSIVGGAALVIILLVTWCIWDGWDMQAAYQPAFGFNFWERIRSAFQSVFHLAESVEVQPLRRTRRKFSRGKTEKDLEENPETGES